MSIKLSHAETPEIFQEVLQKHFGFNMDDFPDCSWEIKESIDTMQLVCVSPKKLDDLYINPDSYRFGEISNMHYYYFSKTLTEIRDVR